MLQEIVDLQDEAVSKLLKYILKQKESTFKAPTGSGKTYMMSDLMNRILSRDENVIFVVSTLSKGNLGEQNFKAFCHFGREKFNKLKPFLIETDTTDEEALFIPLDYNVYVLPRDKYKKDSKLKDGGVLLNFLKSLDANLERGTQGKKIYLIKDECHQATNNLDELIKNSQNKGYFEKVINISATPKLARGQRPNVEVSEDEAVSVGLIKAVELKAVDEESSVEELQGAISEFVKLKKAYLDEQNGVGINPCLIIQISNKDKADKEIETIKEALKTHSELKYMLIVDDKNSNKCESNDKIAQGKKKLSVKKWKSYAKENNSTIDIIIFKMVISEGWDIPRACMLYQMRNSQSKQLDEQVIGRVRRNPCLERFETLNKIQKELISKAYIYGVKPKENNAVGVKLKGQIHKGLFENEIVKEFAISISELKKGDKLEFSVEKCLENVKDGALVGKKDIFTLYRQMENSALEQVCKVYARQDASKWYKFANHFDKLKKEYEKEIVDYDKNVEILEHKGVLALESFFNRKENELDKEVLEEWIWLSDGERFAFDSKAEVEWAKIIRQMYKKDFVKKIVINDENVALFGKNYPYKSEVKFEYYLNGYHFSYPDFVLKDKNEKIHIFEVKSVDSTFSSDNFGVNEYERKIAELERVYQAISKKTPYYFWIPIKQKDNRWVIKCYANGVDSFKGEAFSESEVGAEVQKRLF